MHQGVRPLPLIRLESETICSQVPGTVASVSPKVLADAGSYQICP